MKQKKTRLFSACSLALLFLATFLLLTLGSCEKISDHPSEGMTAQNESTAPENEETSDISASIGVESSLPDPDWETEEKPQDTSEDSVDSDAIEVPTYPTDSPVESETPTQPIETEVPNNQPSRDPDTLTYEQYQALSGHEQLTFFQSFASPEDFFVWYNAAVEDFMERNPGVEIGPGEVFPTP